MSDVENRLSVKSRCELCGLTIQQGGDDAVQILRQIDAAHDVLRPECPAAVNRAASAVSS